MDKYKYRHLNMIDTVVFLIDNRYLKILKPLTKTELLEMFQLKGQRGHRLQSGVAQVQAHFRDRPAFCH